MIDRTLDKLALALVACLLGALAFGIPATVVYMMARAI